MSGVGLRKQREHVRTAGPGKATAVHAARPVISLHIDILHLPGYSVRDAGSLAGALERELGRLLERSVLPTRGHQLDVLKVGRFRGIAGERPESTGRRLARLLMEGLLP